MEPGCFLAHSEQVSNWDSIFYRLRTFWTLVPDIRTLVTGANVMNYVHSIRISGRKFPEPYWANTSSNAIIKDLVWQADEKMRTVYRH